MSAQVDGVAQPVRTGFDASANAPESMGLSPGELIGLLAARWKLLLGVPALAAGLALAYSMTLPNVYTAASTLLPPQQGQSGSAAALASLGSIAGLAGVGGGVRNQGDQYVAFLESNTIADRIIDELKLMEVYGQNLRTHARNRLANSSRIAVNRTSGLISVEVTDADPKRAAEIANRYVIELRRLTASLTLTEAQRRRTFFERLLAQTRDKLAEAQRAVQATGFNASALRSEPKTTAESYVRVQAEVAAAQVQLQSLRDSLTDGAVEVQTQQARLNALRAQLARTEQPAGDKSTSDYATRFREFKYQEVLFELYARQFELARADESRENDSVQVIDVATPPEVKSGPKHLRLVGATAAIALAALAVGILLHGSTRGRRPDASS